MSKPDRPGGRSGRASLALIVGLAAGFALLIGLGLGLKVLAGDGVIVLSFGLIIATALWLLANEG